MDQARAEEARDLVLGPLFDPLIASARADEAGTAGKCCASSARAWLVKVAQVAGCYTLALLTYLSVRVLDEASNTDDAAAREKRLLARLRRAHKFSPFCAELIAFYPAFEPHFPEGLELPEASACCPSELPLRAALEYCCRFGQVAVWLDADEEVRHFLRRTLFEAEPEADEETAAEPGKEETPPLEPLPSANSVEADPPLVARWRRARADAMELWAAEMSVDGSDCDGDPEEDGDSEGSLDSSEAFEQAEDRRFG